MEAGDIDYRGNGPGDDPGDTGGSVSGHEASDHGWEDFLIEGADSILQSGENILAVQMFNERISSSDSSVDVELIPPLPFVELAPPTPGGR